MDLKELLRKEEVILESQSKDVKIYYNINLKIENEGSDALQAKGNGTVFISENDVQKLVSMEDIINFLIEEEIKDKAKFIGSIKKEDLLKEILIMLLNKKNDNLIQREDFIEFSLDYGTEVKNSVGIFLVKQKNSPAFSRIMRLNGKTVPSVFKLDAINKRVLFFSTMEK